MSTYLTEIEHAVDISIRTVWDEQIQVENLVAQLAVLTGHMESGYRRAAAWQDSDDPDDIMVGVGMHWDTYFGSDQERYHTSESLGEVQEKLQVRKFSRESIAGSLLQYAKQGISIVHDGLRVCPSGREIGGQELKNVIWQSRNQSLHWEEGRFRSHVTQCFDDLATEVDRKFADFTVRNMAFDVVELLGWRSYADFRNDMQSLA